MAEKEKTKECNDSQNNKNDDVSKWIDNTKQQNTFLKKIIESLKKDKDSSASTQIMQ